jgi:hypothetical protein
MKILSDKQYAQLMTSHEAQMTHIAEGVVQTYEELLHENGHHELSKAMNHLSLDIRVAMQDQHKLFMRHNGNNGFITPTPFNYRYFGIVIQRLRTIVENYEGLILMGKQNQNLLLEIRQNTAVKVTNISISKVQNEKKRSEKPAKKPATPARKKS